MWLQWGQKEMLKIKLIGFANVMGIGFTRSGEELCLP